MPGYKKIIWCVIVCILTYFSMVSLFFCANYGIAKKNDAQLEIKTSGMKNKQSDGYEIRILSVEIDQEKEELDSLAKKNKESLYENGMLLIRDGTVQIPIREVSNVSIQFLMHPWSGIADITSHSLDIKENVDLYRSSDDVYTFQYTWDSTQEWNNAFWLKTGRKDSKGLQFCIFIIIFFVINVCVYRFAVFARHFLQEKLNIWDVAGFAAAGFITALLTIYVMYHIFGGWLFGFLLILMLFFIKKSKHVIVKNMHYAFVVLYIPFAVLFLFFLPPGHVLDEYAHFVKVYEASVPGDSHTALRKGYEKEGKVYIYLPKSIEKLNHAFMNNLQEYNVQYELENYYDAYTEHLNVNCISEELFWYGNTANLNVTPYIPAILADMVLIRMDCPPLLMFQILRFVNLLLTCIMGYYTILILPDYKKIFLTVLLLPMTVQQGIGINQDWMTNSISFLTIAYLMKTKQADQFQKKDLILLMILSFLLGNGKPVYFPVLFLLFAIPSEKFADKRSACISKAAILLPGTLISVTFCLLRAGTVKSAGELPYYTTAFLFHHPIKTAGIYLNTFLNDGMYHFLGGLYNGFGWYTHYCRDAISGLIGHMLFFMLVGAGEYKRNDKRTRICSMAAFGFLCILVYTSLFLGWTTVDSETVQGLQPRYFIIPLLCFALAVQNRFVCIRCRNKNLIYVIAILGMLWNAVWTIAMGFYY